MHDWQFLKFDEAEMGEFSRYKPAMCNIMQRCKAR